MLSIPSVFRQATSIHRMVTVLSA